MYSYMYVCTYIHYHSFKSPVGLKSPITESKHLNTKLLVVIGRRKQKKKKIKQMLSVTFLSHELLFSITPSRDIHSSTLTYKFRGSHNTSTFEINNNLKDTFVHKTTIKTEIQNRVNNDQISHF